MALPPTLLVHVVLRNEMSRTGMQTSRQETRHEQINQRIPTHGSNERDVEDDLSEDVEEVDGREGDFVDEHGPHGVEEDLEGAEEGFAQEGVEEEGFEGGGEVGVEAVDAEGFVVCEMVGLLWRKFNVSTFVLSVKEE